MADPRNVAPDQRKAPLSALMIAKGRAASNEKVNFCPFGLRDDGSLDDEHLDDLGYCRHLIGFTPPGGDPKKDEIKVVDQKWEYEPMVPRKNKDGEVIGRFVNGAVKPLPRTQKGDELRRMSTGYRVYRDVPLTEEELERATAPETADVGSGSGD